MLFSEVVGQERLKKRLIQSVKDGRIPHAQMFLGPEGSGNLALALAYAQYISCPHRTETDSCGTCPSCKKHKQLQFPDLHYSFPIFNKQSERSECNEFVGDWRKALAKSPYMDATAWRDNLVSDKKQLIIPVKEASSIIRKLSLTAYEGGYKFLLMWMPEMMNINAANRLLKILEEPPDKTIFLLVANSQENIIGTILSRTQIIKIPKLSDDEIRSALISRLGVTSPHKVETITNLSNGNYWSAILGTQTQSDEHFHSFVGFMRMAYTYDMTGLIGLANSLHTSGRENMKQFLEYGLHMLRQCILGNYTGDQVVRLTDDEKSFSSKFSPFINERNIVAFTHSFEEAHSDITRNGYGKLILFDLSIQVAQLLRQ